MRLLLVFFALSFTTICCHKNNNIEPSETLSVNTENDLYTINSFVRISVLNNADFTAHLPSCCSGIAFYLDKYNSSNWHEHLGHGIPCLMMCPSIDIAVPNSKQRVDSFYITEQGTFRIRLPFGRSNENPMAEEILSNTFVVQ